MPALGLYLDALKSEWTKFRSIRSTYWCLLTGVVLGIGLGCAISAGAASHAHSNGPGSDFDPTAISLVGFIFAELAFSVLAVLIVTTEYSSGSIRSTLASIPQRGYVLAAKTTLVGVVMFVISTVSSFIAFWLGQLIFSQYHLNVSLSAPHVLRAVMGNALLITALALLMVGFAFIIRSTAGAITLLAGLAFVVPLFSNLLPDSWQTHLTNYFPVDAAENMNSVVLTSNRFGPYSGFVVLMIWVVAALAAGWLVLRRRDV